MAEVVAHVELGDVADGAGQLDAGGPAADDDEVERRVPAVLDHLPLGQLEGQQDAAANLDGVFDGFEAGSERRPLVVAEVGVGGAGGEDEVVVRELGAAEPRVTWRAADVDADDLVHEHLGVLLVAQDGADGLGDVGRREHGQGHLVEERLKDVVVAAVDDRDVDGEPCEAVGGVDAGKAAADNDHAGAAGPEWLSRLVQRGNASCFRCAARRLVPERSRALRSRSERGPGGPRYSRPGGRRYVLGEML